MSAYSLGLITKSSIKQIISSRKEETELVMTGRGCDDFLKKYEKWVDEYLVFLTEYKNNPDEKNLQKFMTMSQDALGWAMQWTAMYDCANDEKYEKEFERIGKKVEDKMEELGME